MSDGRAFDILIFGFRNDIARARVLDFLHQLPPDRSGPAPLDRATSVPQRLFSALDRDDAQRLRAQLEDLGAQVMLLEAGSPTIGGSFETSAPAAAAPSKIRPLTLALVLALGVACYLWGATQRVQVPQLPAPPLQRDVPLDPYVGPPEPAKDNAAVRFNAEALELARSGEFRDAIDRLQAALDLAPADPVLTRNLQTLLLNRGAAELAADNLDDAAEHLDQAAQLGERVEVLQVLGVTYLRQGHYARAAATLERALQSAPSDQNSLLALAQVRLKQDRRPQALELLERAKEAGASAPGLDSALQQLSREVDAEWNFVRLESRHFRVSFADDDDRSAVRQVLGALEDAYETVGDKFNYYPQERTPVVLYTQQDFHAVTQTPDWAGAAFDGRIKLPVRGLARDDPGLARVVTHEYAHSVVARLSDGRCPVWLNEGRAVWSEEVEDGDHQAWAQAKIAGQELLSLEELSGSFTRLAAERAQVAYAESYLAVHTLVDRYGLRKLPALLEALSREHNLKDAFAATYPGDLDGFEQQLARRLSG